MQAKHRILLADDSLTMHRAVKLALEGEGSFEVATVDNGEDALRLAEKINPDLILADLDMPGLTGAQLTAALRDHPSLASVKIILLCSGFDGYSEDELAKIPADNKIWKPFEASQLLTLVKKTLQAPASAKVNENITVERLGDPVFSHSDLAKALTEETFQSATSSDSTPDPSVEIESELTLQNYESPSPVESTPEVENLWGIPDEPLTPLATENSEFEVIGAENPAPFNEDFTHEAQTQIIGQSSPVESQSFEVSDFSSYEAPESEIPHLAGDSEILAPNPAWSPAIENASPSMGGFSETEIRTMIREEIREAIQGWLKKKLEEDLAQVMMEIDRT